MRRSASRAAKLASGKVVIPALPGLEQCRRYPDPAARVGMEAARLIFNARFFKAPLPSRGQPAFEAFPF